MATGKIGWHLGNARAMKRGDWGVLDAVPPVSVVFLTGEAIGRDQVKRMLRINSNCHFFLRPYYKPSDSEASFRGYLEGVKAMIAPGSWEVIPEEQRHLQIFNEQNMPHTAPVGHPTDQWEGFGPSEEAMKRFNRWFCIAYDELKAVNPAWRIGFTPLTPGNRDAYFRTDPVGATYYMHGPEASFGDPCDEGAVNPSDAQIAAAIKSGPCYEALERADEYLAHVYVINDAEHQMHELWAGLRFVQYAKFFPKPMDVWITELGIGGDASNWVRWFELLDDYPEVKGTGIWRLGYEVRSAGEPLVKVLKAYTGGAVPGPVELLPIGEPAQPEPEPEPEPGPTRPAAGRCLVGLCGRNEPEFRPADHALIESAKIEMLKMMSFAPPEVFRVLKEANPDIDFVVRLYDGRFGVGRRPTPGEFAEGMNPLVESLQSYVDKFEVHNEPNHLRGIEGWGQEDGHAADFNGWFLEVYDRIKQACPWVSLGFPGLAIPHRDLEWIELCREAVERADWLGIHSYWQNLTVDDRNHLADFWGLRFKAYHTLFPNKNIHITEFGNSNCQGGYSVDFARIAQEYVEYYQELFEHSYVRSASSFLMSAPQPEWWWFAWREETGAFRPVVNAVGAMERPMPAPPPVPEPVKAPTGAIRNAAWNEMGIPLNPDACFQRYARKHGLGVPLTGEFDVEGKGATCRAQGFVGGIVFCEVPLWDLVEHMEW